MERVIVERAGVSLRLGAHGLEVCGSTAVLEALEVAHSAIASPHVPLLERRGERRVLACGRPMELGAVLAQVASRERKIGYGAAVAFNEFLMDAAEAGHRAGYRLGALAWSSILCGEDGTLWLFGFGLEDGDRPHTMAPGACVAPELTLGLPPTEASDVFVLHAMVRTLLPFAALPESYAVALTPAGRLGELHEAMMALAQQALSPDPALRPQSIAALRERYRAIRPLVPGMAEADGVGLRGLIAEAVSELNQAEAGPALVVDETGRSLRLEGVAIDLSRRALLWRLLKRLVVASQADGDTVLSADELIDAGWPGERMLPEAGKTRLYTAIRDLRKAGLGDRLLRRDGGYLLDPVLRISRS